jgi:hypothetical protein
MNPNDLQLEDVFDKNDFVDEVEVLAYSIYKKGKSANVSFKYPGIWW